MFVLSMCVFTLKIFFGECDLITTQVVSFFTY